MKYLAIAFLLATAGASFASPTVYRDGVYSDSGNSNGGNGSHGAGQQH